MHDDTYGIEPETIECCFIRVGWCHDVSLDDLFLAVPEKYETIYLLCCEHIETCSPDGCKACSEVPEGYSWLWAQVWGESKYYVDSYSTGSAIDRKSTSRWYFSMGSSVISWFGRMESCMVLSTTEEKYVATCYLGGSMFLLKATIWFGWSDLHFCMMQRGAVIQIEISWKREF